MLIAFTLCISCYLFFFNDPPTTVIYTLSLHDALPISYGGAGRDLKLRSLDPMARPPLESSAGAPGGRCHRRRLAQAGNRSPAVDRKSTRLNSSHPSISYAVFCLKKKTQSFHLLFPL